MSVFTEPLAQLRSVAESLDAERLVGSASDVREAVNRIERRAEEMEKALRDLDGLAQAWLKADTFDGLDHRERRRVAHARARMVADRIADVLPAREDTDDV